MTSTIHRRLLMLKKACRRGDFEGWARESRHWFEMDGMVRRLYMGDGLAVNAHEDGFFGHGIDSISVSGTGVNIVLDAAAPSATAAGSVLAVAVPFSLYAIGVAGELVIKPVDVLGDTKSYFQAIMFFSGKQISDSDLYSLAVAAGG